jgi:hypothetical protein
VKSERSLFGSWFLFAAQVCFVSTPCSLFFEKCRGGGIRASETGLQFCS